MIQINHKLPNLFCGLLLLGVAACSSNSGHGGGSFSTEDRRAFASPDEAVAVFMQALRADDQETVANCLGDNCEQLVSSGDEVSDRGDRERFVQRYDERHGIEMAAVDRAVLTVGPKDWPLPIPIVRREGLWYFDAEAGFEEVLNRRVGRNELDVMQVCYAIVDAQVEYARRDWDEDGLYVYAQQFRCSEGKKDGLYWESAPGEIESPIGRLVAAATEGGYRTEDGERQDRPFCGYRYRLLRKQGSHAPGGAYSYMVGDKMIGGFAVIAYPATYGNSGIMSFMISHDGWLYEKDLGEDTERIATEIETFDPDETWRRVSETDLEPIERL